MVFACYHKVIFFHAEKSQKKDEDKDGVLYGRIYINIYILKKKNTDGEREKRKKEQG